MESESRRGSANHAKIMGTETEKKATEGSQAVTKTLLSHTQKGHTLSLLASSSGLQLLSKGAEQRANGEIVCNSSCFYDALKLPSLPLLTLTRTQIKQLAG